MKTSLKFAQRGLPSPRWTVVCCLGQHEAATAFPTPSMSSDPLLPLDGLIQVIHGEDSRYVVLSRVTVGSIWTVEVGAVGEAKPQWWRAMNSIDDLPASLVRTTVTFPAMIV